MWIALTRDARPRRSGDPPVSAGADPRAQPGAQAPRRPRRARECRAARGAVPRGVRGTLSARRGVRVVTEWRVGLQGDRGGDVQAWGSRFAVRLSSIAPGNAIPDVPVARRIAHVLRRRVEAGTPRPPRREDALRLLRMKNGLNPLGMSFLLPFLESTLRESSAEVYFMTGEWGRSHSLTRGPAAVRRSATACSLPGAPVREVLAGCGERAHRHRPGRDPRRPGGLPLVVPRGELRQRYAHFVLCERDEMAFRGRGSQPVLLWDVTPFTSLEFVEYARRTG